MSTRKCLAAVAIAAAFDSPGLADTGENYRLNTQGELAFLLMRRTPEWMGFHKGGFPMVLNDDDHWQGIARANSNGRQYLFLTRSGEFDSLPEYPALDIVEMGSRTSGPERMRSNRLLSGQRTPGTTPDARDRVVNEITFTDYRHPGGIQVCGDVLAIPFEGRRYDSLPQGVIRFYDIADPVNPVLLTHAGPIEKDHNIGVCGLTRMDDGKYLVIMTWGSNRHIQLYRSSTTDLRDAQTHWQYITQLEDEDIEGWPVDGGAGIGQYQTLNFLTGPLGTLYLFVARNTTQISSEDRAALYQVTVLPANIVLMTRLVSETNFYCSPWAGASVQCNFIAAVGAYVSPAGQLIMYSAEHYEDGPGGTIKMAEFNSMTDRNGSDAWIQLFEQDDESGRSIIVDAADENLDDYHDFEQLDGETVWPRIGFNDRSAPTSGTPRPARTSRSTSTTAIRTPSPRSSATARFTSSTRCPAGRTTKCLPSSSAAIPAAPPPRRCTSAPPALMRTAAPPPASPRPRSTAPRSGSMPAERCESTRVRTPSRSQSTNPARSRRTSGRSRSAEGALFGALLVRGSKGVPGPVGLEHGRGHHPVVLVLDFDDIAILGLLAGVVHGRPFGNECQHLSFGIQRALEVPHVAVG
jgi:hypothetical protein